MATERFIMRHSLQTRITHGLFAVSCVWLMISGLFVFVPQLAETFPSITQGMRVSHRIVGAILILIPIVSALLSRDGVKRFFAKYFAKWTPEDKEFMIKFVPYMLAPKKVHMPDQDEVKSGQRIADGIMMLSALAMMISGLVLWLGTDVWHADATAIMVMRFVHDIFFLVLVIFVAAHVYLGAGIFQPYRPRMIKTMWGDGLLSESSALYHWGFWARKELEEGTNVYEYEVDAKGNPIKDKPVKSKA